MSELLAAAVAHADPDELRHTVEALRAAGDLALTEGNPAALVYAALVTALADPAADPPADLLAVVAKLADQGHADAVEAVVVELVVDPPLGQLPDALGRELASAARHVATASAAMLDDLDQLDPPPDDAV